MKFTRIGCFASSYWTIDRNIQNTAVSGCVKRERNTEYDWQDVETDNILMKVDEHFQNRITIKIYRKTSS